MILRIEDHDRQRCRPEYETRAPRRSRGARIRAGPADDRIAAERGAVAVPAADNGAAYAAAFAGLDAKGLVYACDCSRSTFAAWVAAHGRAWSGPGCPGGCADRGLARSAAGFAWRIALGDGLETWADLVLGLQRGRPSEPGDLPVRDRTATGPTRSASSSTTSATASIS